MIDISTIDDALYDWAFAIDQGEVIKAFDNGTKPDTPFISWNYLNLNPKGQNIVTIPDASGIASIIVISELSIMLQGYGPNAFGRISKFDIAPSLETISDDLRSSVGLSMANSTPTLNLTGVNDWENEERASKQINFNVGVDYQNINIGLIERVRITSGKFKQGDNTLIDKTIDIDSNNP